MRAPSHITAAMTKHAVGVYNNIFADGHKVVYTCKLDSNSLDGVDPRFGDAVNGDFRLQPDSPARTLGRDVRNLIGRGTDAEIPAGAYITGEEVIGVAETSASRVGFPRVHGAGYYRHLAGVGRPVSMADGIDRLGRIRLWAPTQRARDPPVPDPAMAQPACLPAGRAARNRAKPEA